MTELRVEFANGRGVASRKKGSDVWYLTWDGRDAGSARYVPHVRLFARNGKEYASLRSVMKAVEVEMPTQPQRQPQPA